jgi:hypothetical protein
MWARLRYVKWTLWAILAVTLFGFFHYVLPQHDTVRIVNTFNQRIDFGENSIFWGPGDAGTDATQTTRDVKFIETIQANGKPMIYRNEDTGWIWPPYFKFNSFNVQAEASDLKSTSAAPQWVMITHYGWRNEWLTIFPNAVSVRAVDGPDASVFPWVNIVILLVIAFLLFMLRRMWLQFRERTIDPALEGVTETLDQAQGQAEMAGKRAKGWLSSWRRKS